MGSRIDTCWQGEEYPLTFTQAAQTEEIGMSLADWLHPTETVCATLQTALNDAYAALWTVIRNASTGKISITSHGLFDVVMRPGWATWAGFTSSTYNNNLTITSEVVPPHFMADVRVGYTIPIRGWLRSVQGQRRPVVWGSLWAWDVVFTTQPTDGFEVPRTPFVVYNGDLDDWALDDRDGFLALRPLHEQLQREPKGARSYNWSTRSARCAWLNPTL